MDYLQKIQFAANSYYNRGLDDAIIKSDLTDMADIMMEIMKEIKEK